MERKLAEERSRSPSRSGGTIRRKEVEGDERKGEDDQKTTITPRPSRSEDGTPDEFVNDFIKVSPGSMMG